MLTRDVDSLSGNVFSRLIGISMGQTLVFLVCVFFLLFALLKLPGFCPLGFQQLDGFPRGGGARLHDASQVLIKLIGCLFRRFIQKKIEALAQATPYFFHFLKPLFGFALF